MSSSNSSNNKKGSLKIALENRYISQFYYNTFENFEPIAEGGFGQVKRACSKTLRKDVALKCLHSVNNEDDFYKKFTNEVCVCVCVFLIFLQ